MVTGLLREKNGYFHIVLNYKDDSGKRQSKSISTGLLTKGNKKSAEKMLLEARQGIEETVNKPEATNDILFIDFLQSWLEMMKSRVEATTYAGYSKLI